MSIRTRCPSCSTMLQAPESVAGKTISCPRCQHRVVIAGAVARTTVAIDDRGFIPGDDEEPAPSKRETALADGTGFIPGDDDEPAAEGSPPQAAAEQPGLGPVPAQVAAVSFAPDDGRLPWFYPFLNGVAYCEIILGTIALWVNIVVIWVKFFSDLVPSQSVVAGILLLVNGAILQIGILIAPAVMLLFVDIGRSLRQQKRH